MNHVLFETIEAPGVFARVTFTVHTGLALLDGTVLKKEWIATIAQEITANRVKLFIFNIPSVSLELINQLKHALGGVKRSAYILPPDLAAQFPFDIYHIAIPYSSGDTGRVQDLGEAFSFVLAKFVNHEIDEEKELGDDFVSIDINTIPKLEEEPF